MRLQLSKNITFPQRGAVYVEYAFGLLFVVGMLAAISTGLLLSGMIRVSGTVNVQKNVTPCSDRLTALTSDYAGSAVGTPIPSTAPNPAEQALCY